MLFEHVPTRSLISVKIVSNLKFELLIKNIPNLYTFFKELIFIQL